MNLIKNKGFTIIEAIVSLALFAIAFSGLYFFFGMAHQAYNNSEKRMHLNLMANHILDTIHAEAYRTDTDVANPFITPASYNANLSDCATYTASDVRHTWCTELDATVGPHKGVHAEEVRTVEVVKDEAYLIADVTLVIDAGIGEKNLIKTFLSRKIAPPRVDPPSVACIERHNTLINFIKKQKADCEVGDYTRQFTTNLYQNFRLGKKETTWRTQCAPYRGVIYYSGLSSGVGFTYRRDGFMYSVGTMFSWGGKSYTSGYRDLGGLAMQFGRYAQWQMNDDMYSPGTIYGADYTWGQMAPGAGLGNPNKIWNANDNDGEPGTMGVVKTDYAALCAGHPKAKCGFTSMDAHLTVVSCCPTEKLDTGRYKQCGIDYKSRSDRSPFLAETITF